MMNESRDEVRAARFDTTNGAVNRRRDDHVVDRRPVGELNLWRVAVAGPHRASLLKIGELHRESPPRGRGDKIPGWSRPRTAVVLMRRFFFRARRFEFPPRNRRNQ